MKTGEYTHQSASVLIQRTEALPEHMRDGVLEVVSLYVPADDRRKGYATALMSEVVMAADDASTVLMLIPRAYSDGTMSAEALGQFYRKFGFIPLPDGLMARQPRIPARYVSQVRRSVAESLH